MTTEQEEVLFEQRGITISTSRALIGRRVYKLSEIESVSVEELKPQSNLLFILIFLLMIVFAFFSFRNIFGVLLLLIILAPSLWSYINRRSRFAINIKTTTGESKPAISLDQEKIQKIVSALNDARLTAESLAHKDKAEPRGQQSYNLPGVTGQFIRTIPGNCLKCDYPLTLDEIVWMDMRTGKCPRCGVSVEITWQKDNITLS
jgi:hypothetical protein